MPPNSVWMPNHPQATSARISAGTLEPMIPNEERSMTGKGMPNLVPPKALRIRGTSTMTLATKIAHSASPTDKPKYVVSTPPRVYVGTQIDMPTQSAAICHLFQVRCATRVGAMSSLNRGLTATSAPTSSS